MRKLDGYLFILKPQVCLAFQFNIQFNNSTPFLAAPWPCVLDPTIFLI